MKLVFVRTQMRSPSSMEVTGLLHSRPNLASISNKVDRANETSKALEERTEKNECHYG